MSFTTAADFLFDTLGVAFPDLLLILTGFCGLIFMAKDLKIGLIACLLLFGMDFLGLSAIGSTEAHKALILTFISAMGLTLSLFTSAQKVNVN